MWKTIKRSRPALLMADGKCVCIQKKGSSYQLVLRNSQINDENARKVTVYDVKAEDSRMCMAFCFKLNNKNNILPVVAGCGETIDFKVFHEDEHLLLDETFLFRWQEEVKPQETLNSVAVPTKFLSVNKDKVTISSKRMTSFHIKSLTANKKKRGTEKRISAAASR